MTDNIRLVEFQEPPKTNLGPVCPHCLDDPMRITTTQMTFPTGLVTCLMFCGNPECRKLISATPIGQLQPRIIGAMGMS